MGPATVVVTLHYQTRFGNEQGGVKLPQQRGGTTCIHGLKRGTRFCCTPEPLRATPRVETQRNTREKTQCCVVREARNEYMYNSIIITRHDEIETYDYHNAGSVLIAQELELLRTLGEEQEPLHESER